MRDWNDIDAQAEREARAIGRSFHGVRLSRTPSQPSRQSISTDYRVTDKKVDKLALNNVISGRST